MTGESDSRTEILENLRQQQRLAWEHGRQLLVEELTSALVDQLTESQLFELICFEAGLRLECGETCAYDEYQSRFPQFADSLSRFFKPQHALDHRADVTHEIKPAGVSLETFVQQLEGSKLLSQETIKECIPPQSAPRDASQLIRELVEQQKLTTFQAEEVSKGRGNSLVLGNYILLEKIGAGGMGQVFKARHQRMDRIVALKLLPEATTRDKAAIARFEREVKAAAKINHPNIVAAHDADCAMGVHFLVMEYIEGSDLSKLVKKNGPFSIDEAVRCILQAAKGLEAAHKKGIIHRDIKPANLLLDSEGTVKVLDLGLARMDLNDGSAQAELTATDTVMGTVDYMAPEQAVNLKSADARADIYSLGCSLHYLLAGKPTYEGDSFMNRLLAHREQPIPSLRAVRPDIPAKLEAVFNKMVAKKVEDRFQTMSEVVVELSRCPLSQDTRPIAQQSTDTKLDQSSAVTHSKQCAFERTAMTEVLPVATATRPPSEIGRKKFSLLGGVIAAMALLAVIIVNLQTKDGKLVVEVDQPDSTVQVLNTEGKVEISKKGEKGTVSISVDPGKHRLKVEKDGFTTFGQEFEMKSGGKTEITAKLIPLKVEPVAATGKPLAFETPGFEKWVKEVQAMPAEKQVAAVSKKLVELNPGFDGKLTHAIESEAVIRLEFVTDNVTDISPVRALAKISYLYINGSSLEKPKLADLSPLKGLRLSTLSIGFTLVADISPLIGMDLQEISLNASKVSDLSCLKGMPLKSCQLARLSITDLSPLAGMPLISISCWGTAVSDLGPLRGMPLGELNVEYTKVNDLSPLIAMPLTKLWIANAAVSDLSPLEGMKLTEIRFTPQKTTKGMNVIRQMGTLKTIGLDDLSHQFSPNDFWKKYDAGEFGTPTTPSKPLAFQTPGFDQWVKNVQALPAEKQVEAVSMKLMELNPGFDGKLTGVTRSVEHLEKAPTIENGVVTGFGFSTDHVTDISPVRALTGLVRMWCRGSTSQYISNGRLSDVSPLKGMALDYFDCSNNPSLTDLTPLRGIPLKILLCDSTKVSNLSPLKEMPLEALILNGTPVVDLSPLKELKLTTLSCFLSSELSDLSPLAGMALTNFNCDGTKVSDLTPLRGMPLTELYFGNTKVSDLKLLSGMKLTDLRCNDTVVSDLSPLQGMNLTRIVFTPKNITNGLDVIRQMKTIEKISIRWTESLPADEFWKKYDAGEFGKPLAYLTPGFDQWIKDVQALPVEKQMEAVSKKLVELNPGFDGKFFGYDTNRPPEVQNGAVSVFGLLTDSVTDVSPVRAFSQLGALSLIGSSSSKGQLSDLSPLKGMKLNYLLCKNNPGLSDLSPLTGIPLGNLHVDDTQVSDLSPLKGMELKSVSFDNTNIRDLSPLNGMPLFEIAFAGTKVSDLSPLRGMKLVALGMNNTQVADLSPIEEMPLTKLLLSGTNVIDLSPLKKMKLESLYLEGLPVADLSILKGMPLNRLVLSATEVSDLSPLKGMPLSVIGIAFTKVSDLSPLAEMPLTVLAVSETTIIDLSPLEGMKLIELFFSPKNITKGLDVIRNMKTIERIGVQWPELFPPAEFWKKYDAGEFQ